jgi:hypothetical protein
MDPKTARHVVQTFKYELYVGKLGSNFGRLVYAGASTHGPPKVLNILMDGTVLMGSERVHWIGPNDPPVSWNSRRTSVRLHGMKLDAKVLHANTLGLVVTGRIEAEPEKAFFVPLEGREPMTEQSVELLELGSGGSGHKFWMSDNWLLWGGSIKRNGKFENLPITAMNCESMQRFKLPAPDNCEILGLEDKLAVIRQPDAIVSIDIAERKTLASYPTKSFARLLGIHDGIGYFHTPSEMVALDLIRKGEVLVRKVMPPPDPDRMTYSSFEVTPLANGLLLGTKPTVEIEWVVRP